MKVVKFKICESKKNNGEVIGKAIEGEKKGKVCFLPEWCNEEKIGKIGEGFVIEEWPNRFILGGISFEKT